MPTAKKKLAIYFNYCFHLKENANSKYLRYLWFIIRGIKPEQILSNFIDKVPDQLWKDIVTIISKHLGEKYLKKYWEMRAITGSISTV